ncbi:MAG: hypothetical protein H6P94_658 [Thermoplasmatales archaeon]|nr:hypothetical protein [Thermoplasmatales archaeon]
MEGRKKAIYLGAVVLGLLMIVPATNVLGTVEQSQNNAVQIVTMHATPTHEMLVATQTEKAVLVEKNQNIGTLDTDVQVTVADTTENNPAIGAAPTGELLVGYTSVIDSMENNVVWDFSTDGGQTWDGGVYFTVEGAESHPAIDYWGSDRKGVGTMQGDYLSNNGADQHTLLATDITDTTTYELSSITWGASFPYSDRRIPDIAGYDGNGISWWYGIIACVGTRASPGSVDMPIFNYANYADETQGWSSYFGEYSGCENAAIEIDPSNGLFYAVFDIYRTSQWDLLLIRGDAHDDGTGHIEYIAESFIGGTENTKYPAVDVKDNKVIILAQSDEAGSQDIVCYYSDDAGVSFEKSFVAASTSDDELYPKIVSFGDDAICTFIMNDDLYYSSTEDGGATWSAPEMVNDQAGSVNTEYRNTDITYDGTVVWTDLRNGNDDVYLDNIAETPTFPILSLGSFAKAGLGKVSIPVTNIGSADAANVSVTITVTGGILNRINKTKTETLASLAMNEVVNITTDGMIFGIGTIALSATASCAEAQPPQVSKSGSGKVFIVFLRNIA